jgi:hypothetical protein
MPAEYPALEHEPGWVAVQRSADPGRWFRLRPSPSRHCRGQREANGNLRSGRHPSPINGLAFSDTRRFKMRRIPLVFVVDTFSVFSCFAVFDFGGFGSSS